MSKSTTIQRSLLLNMVLLITLISGAILTVVYFAGARTAVRTSAMARIKITADATDERLRLLFGGVTDQLMLARDWGISGLYGASDHDRMTALFAPILSKTPHMSSVMIADESGNSWGLARAADDIVTRSPDGRHSDPRNRAWYVGAMNTHFRHGIYWTQPYTLSASGQPGITASIRCDLDNDGAAETVVAFDVALRDITDFTSRLYVSERGQAFVIADDDAVIGLPRAAMAGDSAGAEHLVFSAIDELGIGAVSAAFSTWTSELSRRGEHFRFQTENAHWWGGFRHHDIGSNRTLWIGVIVAETDFGAEAVAWRNYTIATTIVALGIAMLMATLLARRYGRPLKSLAGESRRLREWAQANEPEEPASDSGSDPLRPPPPRIQNSGIREIDNLADDFAEMATQVERKSLALEQHSRTLEHKVTERTDDLNSKNLELVDTLAQLHEMQQQLLLQEKMASLGNLVAGVAHEVNSPIGAINGAADVVRRCLAKLVDILDTERGRDVRNVPEFQKALRLLTENNALILEGGQRVSGIVKNLRNFSRLDEADLQLADVHEGIDSTLALAQHMLKGRIEVVRSYGDLPHIMCYPNELNQVFMNLFANAAQAIDGKGTITVNTGRTNDSITVSVADSGRGISPEHLDRVFDPGFTTKGVGVGTGLGLSISHRIIEKHGGAIHVKSEPGVGTEFLLTLPIARD